MKTSSWLVKLVDWTTWISLGIGFLFILLALVQVVYGTIPNLFNIPAFKQDARLFGDTEIVNFFIASTSFFVISIALMILKWRYIKE
jgi:hypothetical protein